MLPQGPHHPLSPCHHHPSCRWTLRVPPSPSPFPALVALTPTAQGGPGVGVVPAAHDPMLSWAPHRTHPGFGPAGGEEHQLSLALQGCPWEQEEFTNAQASPGPKRTAQQHCLLTLHLARKSDLPPGDSGRAAGDIAEATLGAPESLGG